MTYRMYTYQYQGGKRCRGVSGFVVWRTASSRRARSVTPGMVVESSRVVFLSVGRCAMCCDCEAGSSGVGRPTGDCHYKQGDRAACGRRRVFGCGLDALLCSSEIQIRCTSSKEQGSALLLLFYVRFVLATELLSRNKVAVSSNSYPTFHVLSPNELVGSLFSLLFSSDNKTCVCLCWIWLVRLAEKLRLKVADLL